MLVTALSEELTVGVVQLSVAVAVPRAALMSAGEGLQPSVNVVPVAVMLGAVVSLTVIVWVQVAVLPQASVAV